jgi:hypothetical protein
MNRYRRLTSQITNEWLMESKSILSNDNESKTRRKIFFFNKILEYFFTLFTRSTIKLWLIK